MHHFGSLWIVKQRQDRSHIGVDIDRDEGGVASAREGEPSQIGMDAWLPGEETVHSEGSVLRQAVGKPLGGCFVVDGHGLLGLWFLFRRGLETSEQ